MFDSVARKPRDGRSRRGAALVVTMLTSATVFAVLASVKPEQPTPKDDVVVLVFPGEPSLPPAPTPAGGGSQARRPPPKSQPATDIPKPPTPSLVTEPREAVVVETPAAPESATLPNAELSDAGGNGEGPGKRPGTGKGPGPGGPGEGEGGGGGLRTINAHEAVPRVRVEPEWPRAALAVGLTEGRCVAHVVIDESGAPADVSFKACPVVFQKATYDAAQQWRWYPLLDEGRPVRAQFDIAFLFRR